MLSRRWQRRASAIAIAVGVSAAMPAGVSAQQPLPVGQSKGVRVERIHGQITVIFTKRADRLYRRLAGRWVIVTCTNVPVETGLNGGSTTTGGDTDVRIPKKRRRVGTGEASRPLDYCRISLPARKITRKGRRVRLPRQVLVSVPLTQAGAVRLDEESKTVSMAKVLFIAQIVAEKLKLSTYPTPGQFLAYLQNRSPAAVRHFTPLAGPGATPPAGSVGYWSDGGQALAVVVLSRAGRRLFLEFGADNAVSTNVLEYLFSDELS